MNFDGLFKQAKSMGFDAVQVYLVEGQELNLTVFKGELEKHQMADTSYLSLTGIFNGKMGKYTTEKINETYFSEWLEALKASATMIESEDEVFIYEGDASYREVEGLFCKELPNTSVKDKMKLAFDLEEKVRIKDPRVSISSSFYGEGNTKVRIENSKGLKLSKEVNSAFIAAQVVARENDDSRTGLDYIQSNIFEDFDIDRIADDVVEKATSQLGAKTVKSGTYEIILSNSASTALLSAHISMFSAESVQKGMSKLKGKIGESIAASRVNILDNPFLEKSSKSGAFDDEGVATKEKFVIKEGTLKTFLHNLKTAKKDNVESTGNGFSSNVSPTNFYIEKGDVRYDDALKSMKKGLVITELAGLHSGTNPISGDFSLQASGYLVEDGKITRPVALITVAGNYLDVLNDVTSICDDLKFNFNFIGSPSLKIKSLAVSGE